MKNKTNAGKLSTGNIFVFWGWLWQTCRDDRIRKEGNRGKGVDNFAVCVICILGYYRRFEESTAKQLSRSKKSIQNPAIMTFFNF